MGNRKLWFCLCSCPNLSLAVNDSSCRSYVLPLLLRLVHITLTFHTTTLFTLMRLVSVAVITSISPCGKSPELSEPVPPGN